MTRSGPAQRAGPDANELTERLLLLRLLLRDRLCPRRLDLFRRSVHVADHTAEIRVLGAEQPPTALPARHVPHVGHPEVPQLGDVPAAGGALLFGRALVTEHAAAAEAELLVDVPRVVRAREAIGRRALPGELQVAQADDLAVGARAVVQRDLGLGRVER